MSSEDRRNTLEGTNAPDEEPTRELLRKRRIFYGAVTGAITLILAAAVLGALTGLDTYGVDSKHVRTRSEGYELDVEYPTVSRGGLATPLAIEVTRTGGFSDAVVIGIDHRYMQAWDENGFYPTPSAERTMGDWLIWEFDPPEGDTLRFTYDGRIEPAVQHGRSGRVAVMEANVPVVEVDFSTRITP